MFGAPHFSPMHCLVYLREGGQFPQAIIAPTGGPTVGRPIPPSLSEINAGSRPEHIMMKAAMRFGNGFAQPSCHGGSAMDCLPANEHRQRAVRDDIVGLAAEQQARQTAAAM